MFLFLTRIFALGCTAIACGLILNPRHDAAFARADTEAPAFCSNAALQDYLAPLRRMKDLREIPDSGRLPFAPKNVSIKLLEDGLRVGPGAIGFALLDRAVGRERQLNWEITAELLRVDRNGRSLGVVKVRKWALGKVDLHTAVGLLRLYVGGHPGYYRIDLSIRRRAGGSLGRYAEYVRVVRPTLDVRLALSHQSVARGQSIHARVENLGTEAVAPSSRLYLERFDGQLWQTVASYLTPGLRSRVRAVLTAGRAGRCVEIRIPPEQEEGPYRVRSEVARFGRPSGQKSIFETFQVSPVPTLMAASE
jgi:hypothetical protein